MGNQRGQFGQIQLILDDALLSNLEFKELEKVQFRFVHHARSDNRLTDHAQFLAGSVL